MKSMDELLILFNKSKYGKLCICFGAMTSNLFYNFCPRYDSIHKNFQFKRGRERIFNHCYIDMQGRFWQNLSSSSLAHPACDCIIAHLAQFYKSK